MAKIAPSLCVIPASTLMVFDPPNVKTKFVDPTTKKEKGEERFRATFLWPKTENMDAVKAALELAGKNKNPETAYKDWRKPIKDGDKHIDRMVAKGKSADRYAIYKGMWFVEAKTGFLPDFSKAVNGNAVEVPAELVAREFYSGAKVIAELNFVASEIEDGGDETKRYISAYHNFIVKIGDGPRLGRKSRDEVFKGVLGGVSNQKVDTGDEDF